MAAEQNKGPAFGHLEFWTVIYQKHSAAFDDLAALGGLLNEMIGICSTKEDTTTVHKVIWTLTGVTGSAANDVLMLCGNGSGVGALKIIRGMFESSWTAEYLRQNPNEVDEYIDFGKVLRWRRCQWFGQRVPPEVVHEVEADYNQVRAKFTGPDGRERKQWSTKSLMSIANAIGRGGEYDFYSVLCSVHHANAEGLAAAMRQRQDALLEHDSPPSETWVETALVAAWTMLWFALRTLNDSWELGLGDRLRNQRERGLSGDALS